MVDGGHDDEGDGFGAGTYGASFAEVYDRWYAASDDTDAAVDALKALVAPGASMLELGVGTGRLALPLARAGRRVLAIDAAPEMLAVLGEKLVRLAEHDPDAAARVHATSGDIADPAAWPVGPVDLVLGAFNLICNLTEPAEQASVFRTAADRLRPGGRLVIEAFLPAPVLERERRLDLRSVDAARVVLIASDRDPATDTVTGAHIELVDGAPVRLRPWRIRPTGVDELDRWAAASGLELERRDADWSRATFDPHGAAHVSVYRRPE